MAVRILDVNKTSTGVSALSQKFASRIVGQDAAREALTQLLDKFASGMYDKKKPIGSLLFLGPTGCGKTLVAESFCEGLFGRPESMLKVDCAEFQHSHEIARLIGSPPGYLGHRETHPYFTNASLTAARMNAEGKQLFPFTVVLFDEIEKASDALWNLLLGILDKGVLTTGTNEKVNFRDTIIIMTSNIGSAELATDNTLGFQTEVETKSDKRMEEIATSAARRKFTPEFLNRLDTIVNFKTLTKKDMVKVLDLELEKIQTRVLADSNTLFEVNVSDEMRGYLIETGYDKRYNARALVRAVEKFITIPLSRLIATHQIHDGDVVLVGYGKVDAGIAFAVTGKIAA